MNEGLLDTNVFIHAQTTDSVSEECRRLLAALEQGHVRARLEPLVLHELSFALPHYVERLTREQIARYLLSVLSWPGVQGDAYLAALALQRQCPVYTKNVRELVRQGVAVPEPLPAGPASSARTRRRPRRRAP
jgi:predicted nucleic acid-binding protein